MPKRSRNYWKKRFELIEQQQNKIGKDCYAEIEKQYKRAMREIDGKIRAWYGRFMANNDVSMAEVRKMLTEGEMEEFRWDVKEYIKHGEENAIDPKWTKQLENASARHHISRLETLKIELQQSEEVMFGNQLDSLDSAMREAYQEGFYRTAYEIQNGLDYGTAFTMLNPDLIAKVINKPWAPDGKNFSQRVWGNRTKLVSEIDKEITQSLILGQDPQKAINRIAKKMNTSKSNAGRLVMTEQAFFSSAAQTDCFKALGVEQYEIVATLDFKTSDICREMDGQVFKLSEKEIGINAPPFHCWCRTTTAPYFEDEFDGIGDRAARDADGNVHYVPNDMSYKEWKKEFVDKTRESVIMKSAKEFGIRGKISVNPVKMDVSDFEFDADHINRDREHNVTREEAEKFVRDAKVSIGRWNGRFVNYYGENGAVYLDTENKIIRTAFKRDEYDEKTKKFMEVVLNAKN